MAVLETFRQYAALIESSLAAAPLGFSPESESATAIQVERGIAYPAALLDPKKPSTSIDLLLEAGDRPDLTHLASFAVIDRTGQHRPAYRGLLCYAAFQAFQLTYETVPANQFGRWEEGLRPWADLLEAQLTQIDLNADASGGLPAPLGGAATEAAWMALALQVAGKIYIRDAWTDLASDLFGKITKAQAATGAFLTTTPSDNPEIHWFHELVLLPATATYAVMTENRPLSIAVAKNAQFHVEQTQPDHATNQPWALFPFIWNSSTRTLADAALHSANTVRSPLTSILLADALYCLRLFLK
jgi:hypothetical protein